MSPGYVLVITSKRDVETIVEIAVITTLSANETGRRVAKNNGDGLNIAI